MLEHDLLQSPLVYRDGFVHLPEGPGWGVELDMAAVERYAVRPTVVLQA